MLEEFGDPEIYHRVEAELGKTMTLNEVIAEEFLTVKAPLEEVIAWLLEHARIRPGFAELARLLVDADLERLRTPATSMER